MRDILKRIERLEQVNTPNRIDKIIIQFIDLAAPGKAAPWNPTWANSMGREDAITRQTGETVDAFEARARASLDAFTILMGCDPIPEDVRAALVSQG